MIELFWLCLSVACVGWYVVVLGYVVVRGARDIRSMLSRMSDARSAEEEAEEASDPENAG